MAQSTLMVPDQHLAGPKETGDQATVDTQANPAAQKAPTRMGAK